MLVVRSYTINWENGMRSDKTQDDYYLVGSKDGIYRGFLIEQYNTVRGTMLLMRALGYRPAHSYDVADWARGHLYSCRAEEDEEDLCLETHVSIKDITELDVKPEQLYLYLDS